MVFVGKREYKYGRMIMSHMVADSLDELHKMADTIGVDRRHFQDKPNKPHYDICKKNKKLAIMNGAKLVDERDIIMTLRRYDK